MFRNQTYLDSVYFTFVTMSTIGFGDIMIDVGYLERISVPLRVFIMSMDPILFYINFSLVATIIASLTSSAEADRGDNKVRDENAVITLEEKHM